MILPTNRIEHMIYTHRVLTSQDFTLQLCINEFTFNFIWYHIHTFS